MTQKSSADSLEACLALCTCTANTILVKSLTCMPSVKHDSFTDPEQIDNNKVLVQGS